MTNFSFTSHVANIVNLMFCLFLSIYCAFSRAARNFAHNYCILHLDSGYCVLSISGKESWNILKSCFYPILGIIQLGIRYNGLCFLKELNSVFSLRSNLQIVWEGKFSLMEIYIIFALTLLILL